MAISLQQASRQVLADEMKRKSLTRQLESIAQSNPSAFDTPLNQSLARRVDSSGSGNPGAAQKARWDQDFNYEFNQGPTAYHGGPLSPTAEQGATIPREQMRGAIMDNLNADLDKSSDAQRAISERQYEAAYGQGGAYGRGVATPGGKPAVVAGAAAPDPKAASHLMALREKLAKAQGKEALTPGTGKAEIDLYTQAIADAEAKMAPPAATTPANGTVSFNAPEIDGLSFGGNTPQMRALAAKYAAPIPQPDAVAKTPAMMAVEANASAPNHAPADGLPAAPVDASGQPIMAQPTTKVIAGVPYAKVAGGWQKVTK